MLLSSGECVAKWEVSLFDAFSACTLAFECVLTRVLSQNRKNEQFKEKTADCIEKLKVILCQIQPLTMR